MAPVETPAPCSPPWQRPDHAALASPEPTSAPSPPPAEWNAELLRKLAATRALCAPIYQDIIWGNKDPSLGCNECPHAPDPSAAAPLPDRDVYSPMFHLFEGSFSKAGADEAIAVMGACGPGMSSAAFLLRRHANGWAFLREVDFVDSCSVARVAGGRDVLVCVGDDWNGNSRDAWVSTIDVVQTPPGQTLLLFPNLVTLAIGACEDHEPPFLAGNVEAPELIDLNHDKLKDIRVKLEYAALSKTSFAALAKDPKFAKACECERAMTFEHATAKPGCDCPRVPVPPLRKTSLVFLQRGGTFVPTLATRKLLADIEAER